MFTKKTPPQKPLRPIKDMRDAVESMELPPPPDKSNVLVALAWIIFGTPLSLAVLFLLWGVAAAAFGFMRLCAGY